MPRGPIPKAQIAAMQAARKTTVQDREKALAALQGNAQFTHPKFWAKNSPGDPRRRREGHQEGPAGCEEGGIARLQKKIEKLQADI